MTLSRCVFRCTRPPPPPLPERGLSPEWITAADVLRLGKTKLEPGVRAGESLQLEEQMLCACQCPTTTGTTTASSHGMTGSQVRLRVEPYYHLMPAVLTNGSSANEVWFRPTGQR